MNDREAAAQWARDLLSRQDWCILDTETTGLSIWSEVVQLAIIDPSGAPLLDTLVRPVRAIEEGARRIHGITNEHVADAPGFADVYPRLCEVVHDRTVVVYNVNFDLVMLEQSMHLAMGIDQPRDVEPHQFGATDWQCAMHWYSQWVGDWSDYHGNYRWQKLRGGDHSALGDALATLRVILRMAGVPNASITVPVMDAELDGYNNHYGRHYRAGSWREWTETPIEAALSAFVADLVDSYSERAGSRERQKLALDWLTAWRRDQGWRPAFERNVTNEAKSDRTGDDA